MRFGFSGLALVLGMTAVACGGTDMGTDRHSTPGPVDSSGTPSTNGSAPGDVHPGDSDPGTGGAACPTALPSAIQLAIDPGAQDLILAPTKVYFRTDTTFNAINRDGTGRQEMYKSVDLVRAWADGKSMVFVEAPNAPDLTLKAMTIDGKATFTTNLTGFNAASTHVFASDELYYYFAADVTANGDSIYRASKTTGAVTRIANFGTGEGNDISGWQQSGYDIWFVRGKKRVYVVKQTVTVNDDDSSVTAIAPDTQTEMFASGFQECKLAVAKDAAYCSDGKTITRRDLTGANPTTVFDASSSPAQGTLGAPFFAADVIAMKPVASASDPVKGVIRLVAPSATTAAEKIVACGHDGIQDVAIDRDSVVWSASGTTKGIFIAPR